MTRLKMPLLILAIPAGLHLGSASAQVAPKKGVDQPELSAATRIEDLVNSSHRSIFLIDMDGSISYMVTTPKCFITPEPLIDLLLIDAVADHLELVEFQINDLKRVRNDIREAIQRAETIIRSPKNRFVNNDNELLAILTEPVNSGFRVVDDVLLPHQVPTLERVFVSYRMRRTGLYVPLTTGIFSEMLEITPSQKSRLRKVFETTGSEKFGELAKLKQGVIDQVLDILNDDQKKQLQARFGDSLLPSATTFSVFIHQLSPEYLKAETEITDGFLYPRYFPLAHWPQFIVGFDGLIDFGNWGTDRSLPQIELPIRLLLLLRSPSISERLELTEDQLSALQFIKSLRANFYEEKQQAINDHIHSNGYDGLNELHETWRAKENDFGESLVGKIEDVLVPRQRMAMEQLICVIGCHREGIVRSLCQLELGKSIGVTSDQRERLEKLASSQFTKLQEKSVELEGDLNRELFSILTDEQIKRFKELTVPFVPLETGQMDLHQFMIEPEVIAELDEQVKIMERFLAPIREGSHFD